MAGSWEHAVTRKGKLLSNENFCGMIGNPGDAYEMAEQMFGMIWWLAQGYAEQSAWGAEQTGRSQVLEVIAAAREHYRDGLRIGGRQRDR